jgi:hypothetical protein
MISTGGLAPLAALALIDRQGDRFAEAIRTEPAAKREIARFRDRIGKIESVDELVKDHQLYSFVMKAFGLEGEIFAKAMMKRILTSDPADKGSLVNRLTDPRYREINKVLGFDTDGKVARPGFGSASWSEAMVDRYVTQRMIDGQKEENPAVGLALDFERKAKGLTSWFKVLADPDMAKFIRTAFGLLDSIAQGSIDGQAKLLEQRMRIEDLQDPQVRKKLIRQFAAIAGVTDAKAPRFPIVDLVSRPRDWATWFPIVIDVPAVSPQGISAYRLWR